MIEIPWLEKQINKERKPLTFVSVDLSDLNYDMVILGVFSVFLEAFELIWPPNASQPP